MIPGYEDQRDAEFIFELLNSTLLLNECSQKFKGDIYAYRSALGMVGRLVRTGRMPVCKTIQIWVHIPSS